MSMFFLFALTGCDGLGGDGDEGAFTCEDASLVSDGEATATTPDGAFDADCFDVTLASETVTIRIYEVDLRSGEGIQRRILVRTDGVTPGTYTFEDGTFSRTRADYNPRPDLTLEATSGTVTITERSDERLRGTFSFDLENGAVTDGVFDVGI
ncbi:MAG: hypothetical protein AAF602_01025 [Myxococcota bacterium]